MDKRTTEELIDLLLAHKGKVAGAVIGFIFAIVFLTVGFFKTLVVLICTAIGIIIGARWDTGGHLKNIFDKILPPQFK